MLIKTQKDKIEVNINIRNSKDNAYNTKVTLSFTPNINYKKVEVRFLELIRLHRSAVCVCFLRCVWWPCALCYQPEKDCSLNHTTVECAVGYPFLGKNLEVSVGSRLRTIYTIYHFLSVIRDAMWSDIHRKLSESYLRSVLSLFRRWFRSTWRLPGERITVSSSTSSLRRFAL